MDSSEQVLKVSQTATQFLEYFGIHSKANSIISNVIFFSWMILGNVIVTLGYFGHIMRVIDKNELRYSEISEAVVGSVSCGVVTYSILVFKIKSKEVRQITHDFEHFYDGKVPLEDKKTMKKLDNFLKIAYALLLVSVLLMVIIFLRVSCDENSKLYCGLYLSGYLGFDNSQTPVRQLFMMAQLLAANVFAVGTISVFTVPSIWAYCLILHLQHLGDMLKPIKMLPTRQQRKLLVKKCVLYHCRILTMQKRVQGIAEILTIIFISAVPVCIGFTTYHLVKVELDIKTVVHLVMYIFVTLANCIPAEKLIFSSNKLFYTTIYAIPWDGDVQTVKDMHIMLMTMRKDLCIPAGKFGNLGHERFMELMKASYSFATLLLSR